MHVAHINFLLSLAIFRSSKACQSSLSMTEYSCYTDEQLLSLLQSGNDEVFTELYNRYWERMVTLAYCKLRSAEDAQDVVQDVFLDLWNRRSGLSVRHNFHTYIAAAVKYRLLTLLARQGRQKTGQDKLRLKKEDHCTEEWLSYQQLREELEKTVQALPEKCRLVFRLSRDAGLSEKEITHHLNISTKTVEAHLSKALRVLRTSLKVFLSFFL